MYIYVYVYIYTYIYICICHNENNVPSRLSSQWLCGKTCIYALGHMMTQQYIMCLSA